MSKKTTIISVSIILLLVIAIIFIFLGEKKDRVKNMYENMIKSNNFTFTMEEKTKEINYKVSMAQKENNICIDMYSDEEHTTTLILENNSYYIMHDEKDAIIYIYKLY